MTLRILTVALVSTCWLACSRGPADGKKPPRAIPVRAVAVAQHDVPIEIRAAGRIVSSQSVVVRAEVSGRLVAVHFQEGQAVRAGDLLLEIDPRPYQAALEEARAKLAQDRARAENARADAERYRKLVEKSLVAEQQWAAARAEAEALEALVEGDRAAVQRAALERSRCQLRAPAAGRAGRLLVHPGNTVQASEDRPLLTIENRRPVYAEFSIPERHLSALRPSAPRPPAGGGHARDGAAALPARVRAEGGVEREGALEFVDNAVDPATGTILLRARIANEDEALWPGQMAEVRLGLEVRRGAKVVPAGAVAQGQQGDYAYVVGKDRTVELRRVRTEQAGDDQLVVLEGLAPGELVVTEGHVKLTPGAAVELLGPGDRT